jgi:predicted O-linked N-acetylglucosamine transferase (SPINDLY family)
MQRQLLAQYINFAKAASQQMRHDAAIGWWKKAIRLEPDLPEAWYNLGMAYHGKGQVQKALEAWRSASRMAGQNSDAQNTIGVQFLEAVALREAESCFRRAITLAPRQVAGYFNLGGTMAAQCRPDEALAAFSKAIELDPALADAHYHLGNVHLDLQQPKAALAAFGRVLALKPDYPNLLGTILNTKRTMCEWGDDSASVQEIVGKAQLDQAVCSPFVFLGLVDSPGLQRRVAERSARVDYPEHRELGPLAVSSRRKKIRIGYFSADFHNHATANLIGELFELHDRDQFELVAFSFGPKRQDEMRRRLSAAFDRFLEVGGKSDREVARLSRELGIDIAVDLKGYTLDARPGIFSYRAAPLQVNYLGFPGTMGAAYFDYLIADATLIPPENRQHYSEKIVYLPHSYQVNDRKRRIADEAFTRDQLGLPARGFVFCCFNNNYKITPETFATWMRILGRVDGSVLWLLSDSAEVETRLRQEAERSDVDPTRIVFARRMSLAEHLSRQRAADLFLDTLPYNAHTTASDALWAGLPVLTQAGESFASRVAASLLGAIGLPELITTTRSDYEALAVRLATNPEAHGQLKQRLERNRLTTPLFDTKSFVGHLEAAYLAMYERHQARLPPDHLYVEA